MLYHAYQAMTDASEPMRAMARMGLGMGRAWKEFGWPGFDDTIFGRNLGALLEMTARAKLIHARPPYDIGTVMVGNREVPVREEVVLSLPFCNLLRFAKDDVATAQPKMLVVAPLSGHFATLLRSTVETLSRDHDVYITDWKNARDVPLAEGPFGFDDYIDYVIRCLEHIGPGGHLLAVCQPCVQALAAVAVMAEDRNPAEPRSMTLMAGPIDTRISPTKVNILATTNSIGWFEKNLIYKVPFRLPGAGRKVYPGFIQLMAFMSMNMDRHVTAHRDMFDHLAAGRLDEADKIKNFYDEYFAVLDLTAEFYLETVKKVFQDALLAKGELTYRGRPVNPGVIRRTALLTVEGDKDDICAVGQTAAAHELCSTLRPHLRRHHLQPGVGHYGTFSGKRWNGQIYPNIRNLVLAVH
ncbi:MAG TPA: polyhydroxyalkanoate depolymerase [Alphaproteobacteria bacterium]|nr:polyhydroxyalkanoate depolymerase [Alphaproteobacteria bacterium]